MPAVPDLVRSHLAAAYPGPVAGASVTFLGTRPLNVDRFGPDRTGVVRYATAGVSQEPMHPATATVADPLRGPRAELVLSLRPGRDEVLRTLAVLAATPQVEGLVLGAGATIDLRQPLWPGARVSAVLLGDDELVPPLDLVAAGAVPDRDGVEPVRFYPVLPMTNDEAALARARGAGHLRQLWRDADTDLLDPQRVSALTR
ncbi:suppressor of fused domain protein [Kineosporia sp. J2-2]|uniref:Suppressor of fused domain protein n=1 Tax=Kineosporia corallincola TaxID=2835133 RepID=A0ABS5T8Z4_9ACTN|nr:suppressor of fused domain protein [Kineosporia corallincola]MBT0767536.1 suppressor of fused domain protein [Kineosporia corallincola]